jgi:hypothetical protein
MPACSGGRESLKMRLGGQRLDLLFYLQALLLYARNLGVLFAPLIAAAIGAVLDYGSGPLFAAIGGAGASLFHFITLVIEGFGFAISVIFADDAWRHGRGSLSSAWNGSRRKAGEIIIAVIGFLFLTYVAGLIGSLAGPIGSYVLTALAVWAFIYAIPAAAIGGVPSGGAFSASLRAARRHPVATALLTIVCALVWWGLTQYALNAVAVYMSLPAYYAAQLLLTAIALGYIALVTARQYADLAFRSYW